MSVYIVNIVVKTRKFVVMYILNDFSGPSFHDSHNSCVQQCYLTRVLSGCIFWWSCQENCVNFI